MPNKIMVRCWGGLGNQLFQLAFGLTKSKCSGSELHIEMVENDPVFEKLQQIMEISDLKQVQMPSGETRGRFYRPTFWPYVDGKSVVSSSSIDKIKSGHFVGYWQSAHYLDLSVISHRLRLREVPLSLQAKTDKTDKEKPTAAIHVRRGDYLLPKWQDYFDIVTDTYYQKAMQIMRQSVPGVHFNIFTDDPDWAEEKYSQADNLTIIRGNSDIQDLRLMTECDHCITANSSFSWWAAFLNSNLNKIIIMPMPWFNTGGNLMNDVYISGAVILKT